MDPVTDHELTSAEVSSFRSVYLKRIFFSLILSFLTIKSCYLQKRVHYFQSDQSGQMLVGFEANIWCRDP